MPDLFKSLACCLEALIDSDYSQTCLILVVWHDSAHETTTGELTLADIPPREHPVPLRGSEHDDLMTAEELAQRLRMTRAWVYSETRLDRIPHLPLGRYFRYRRSAIERWIAELEMARAEDDDRSR